MTTLKFPRSFKLLNMRYFCILSVRRRIWRSEFQSDGEDYWLLSKSGHLSPCLRLYFGWFQCILNSRFWCQHKTFGSSSVRKTICENLLRKLFRLEMKIRERYILQMWQAIKIYVWVFRSWQCHKILVSLMQRCIGIFQCEWDALNLFDTWNLKSQYFIL